MVNKFFLIMSAYCINRFVIEKIVIKHIFVMLLSYEICCLLLRLSINWQSQVIYVLSAGTSKGENLLDFSGKSARMFVKS